MFYNWYFTAWYNWYYGLEPIPEKDTTEPSVPDKDAVELEVKTITPPNSPHDFPSLNFINVAALETEHERVTRPKRSK